MDEQTTGSHAARRRTYMDDYRRQVVDMVASTGRTAMSVAAELGIHHTLISRWIRRYRRTEQASVPAPQAAPASPLKPVPVPHADQAAEPDAEHPSGIARLKREVERLRMERDIFNVWPAPSASGFCGPA